MNAARQSCEHFSSMGSDSAPTSSAVSPELSGKMELASFICAILVVAIHVPGVYVATSPLAGVVKQFFSNGICRIAVPYFFLASGFFLGLSSKKGGWYLVALRKRFGSLIIPYVVWSVAWAIFTRLMEYLSSMYHSQGSAESLSCPSLIAVLGLDFTQYPSMYVLWFVRALIVLVIISPLIIYLVRAKTVGRLALVVFFGYLLSADMISCPLMKGLLSPVGIFYFTAGVYFAYHGAEVSLKRSTSILLALLGIVGLLVSVIPDLRLPWMRQFGIVVSLVGFWGVLPSASLTPFLRRTAFPVYLLHIFILLTLAMMIHAITGSYSFNESLAGYFTYWLLGSLGAVVAGKVLLKTWVSRICFGGR